MMNQGLHKIGEVGSHETGEKGIYQYLITKGMEQKSAQLRAKRLVCLLNDKFIFVFSIHVNIQYRAIINKTCIFKINTDRYVSH